MNWKALGKAFLIAVGVFAVTFLLVLIFALLPSWLPLVIGIACVTWLAYHCMTNNYDTDNDRMSWFSNREEEEDDDEEIKED